ncbi:MAG TPA: ceramidase domain-containing protein [Nitrosospira sp.]
MSNRRRLWVLGVLSSGMLLIAAIVPPIPQPPEYHQFADTRSYFGIPNFFNIVSNLAFLFVGIAGLTFLLSSRARSAYNAFIDPHERWPYLLLFLGVAMTGVGSAYYHLGPDNGRLMWDRLPIAIAIMALLSATITERVGLKAGLRLLPVLVVAGALSVVHWHWSEQRGAGNLNFYIVVQFYSILLIVLLGIFFPSRYTRGTDIYIVFAWYGAAKLAEIADREIYDLGHLISGHTAKHLLAASGVYWILQMLKKRKPLVGE